MLNRHTHTEKYTKTHSRILSPGILSCLGLVPWAVVQIPENTSKHTQTHGYAPGEVGGSELTAMRWRWRLTATNSSSATSFSTLRLKLAPGTNGSDYSHYHQAFYTAQPSSLQAECLGTSDWLLNRTRKTTAVYVNHLWITLLSAESKEFVQSGLLSAEFPW